MSDEDPSLLGQIKQKLLSSKQKWAEEGRLLTGKAGSRADRLPPGQHEVKNWPVLDLGIQPEVAKETWSLAIDGLVANKVTWSWDEFMAQPVFEDVSDMHCVTAWSRYDNHWTGVSTQHVLSVVQPLPQARHVVLHSHDGYTTNVRLDHFAAPDALLAHSWEGKPISREHGGPVRVIIPQFYLWKSAKWLKRIEILAEDRPGFWEVRGYHNEGDPWTEERYS
jgi:DMSO/TMAO reductase YedYZ molybdopterin-dependent catalytic subunit